jgi:hypothetical protein
MSIQAKKQQELDLTFQMYLHLRNDPIHTFQPFLPSDLVINLSHKFMQQISFAFVCLCLDVWMSGCLGDSCMEGTIELLYTQVDLEFR